MAKFDLVLNLTYGMKKLLIYRKDVYKTYVSISFRRGLSSVSVTFPIYYSCAKTTFEFMKANNFPTGN